MSSLFLAVLLVVSTKNDVTAKLIGQGLFIFVVAIIIFIRIGFVKCKNFNLDDVRYARKIALPNIFHQISQMIMSQSDRVIILSLSGAVTAAKYSVVYNFGLILQMIWNATNEVWVPWLYRALHEKKIKRIISLSRIYLFVFTFGAILLTLVAPDFLVVLAPISYQDAKPIITPIILATYFMFLYSFFANIEIYNKKNKYMAVFTMFAAVFNIWGNYIFIPIYGYGAAAYTTLFSYILLMLLHYTLLHFVLKLDIYPTRMFIVLVNNCVGFGLSPFYRTQRVVAYDYPM